jgi:hypothetical protein
MFFIIFCLSILSGSLLFILFLHFSYFRPCYEEHVTILDVKYGDMHIATDFTIRELAIMCNIFLTLHEKRRFAPRHRSGTNNRKLDDNLEEVMNKVMEKLATVKILDRILQNEDTLSDGD